MKATSQPAVFPLFLDANDQIVSNQTRFQKPVVCRMIIYPALPFCNPKIKAQMKLVMEDYKVDYLPHPRLIKIYRYLGGI